MSSVSATLVLSNPLTEGRKSKLVEMETKNGEANRGQDEEDIAEDNISAEVSARWAKLEKTLLKTWHKRNLGRSDRFISLMILQICRKFIDLC